MGKRDLNQFAWCSALMAGLAGTSIACSKDEPPPNSAAEVGNAQIFRFAPPDGTEYIRTDRKTEEVAIVGAPLRRVESEELRWRSRIGRGGDGYLVTQDLIYFSLARDGETLARGDVPEGISATLAIDEHGTLTGVKGLERTAEVIRSLVVPDQRKEAEQIITPDLLANIVGSRYKVLFGETIGRPATPGSSWTVTNPAGSFVTSRTVTVTGHEACGRAICARLKVDLQIDPKAVTHAGESLVRSAAVAAGEDPSQVTLRSASCRMSGWMLVEPATMLSHGASLTEDGSVTVADSKGQVLEVAIKGTTELSYSYADVATSERSSAPVSRTASK